MKQAFLKKIYQAHQQPKAFPGSKEVELFLTDLLQFLFPELNTIRFASPLEVETRFNQLKLDFEKLLIKTEACQRNSVMSVCQCFFIKNFITIFNNMNNKAEAP